MGGIFPGIQFVAPVYFRFLPAKKDGFPFIFLSTGINFNGSQSNTMDKGRS
jgi:hypothetical protein